MAKQREGKRPAVDKMWDWLDYEGAQIWLSFKLRVGQSTVSRWVSGICVPAAHYRQAIASLSGGRIMSEDWYSPSEHEIAHRFDKLDGGGEAAVVPKKKAKKL